MENDTGGERLVPGPKGQELVTDVAKSSTVMEEETEIETKNTTVFVKSATDGSADNEVPPGTAKIKPDKEVLVPSTPDPEFAKEPVIKQDLYLTNQCIAGMTIDPLPSDTKEIEQVKQEVAGKVETLLVELKVESKEAPEEKPIGVVEEIKGEESTPLKLTEDKVVVEETPLTQKEQTQTIDTAGQTVPVETKPSASPRKEEMATAEIMEENIKEQLQQIINEIDIEVDKEENGSHNHTWKPKGHYEIKRTQVQHKDIVPITMPEVTIHEREEPVEEQHPEPPQDQVQIEPLKMTRHRTLNGEIREPESPVEIPVGIPLLARILPKSESEDEEPREKIPLERLFTPATDAELLVPQKKKKAFASSCFYRPDHPTIDDQVELAHKISVSLVDENNKASKGHNMYMKRKNRSSKWVHQAAQYGMEEVEEEKKSSVEKPPLKLLLNPRGIQDYTAVQRHYEELMTAAEAAQQIAHIERSKEIASTLESPTGKGAALFAKRKKRMDQFIVDETNVQSSQPFHNTILQEERTKSHDAVSKSHTSFSSSATQEFESHTTAMNGLSSFATQPAGLPGSLQLPDLTQILTQPKPSEKTTTTSSLSRLGIATRQSSSSTTSSSKTTSPRTWAADSKTLSIVKSLPAFGSRGPAEKKSRVNGIESHRDFFAEKETTKEPPRTLRPGTPPTFLVPDGTGRFIEKQTKTKTEDSVNKSLSSDVTTNNGTAMNTTNEATKNTINYNFSALHSLFDPEAYYSAAFQEPANPVRPSSKFQKQTGKTTYNCSNLPLDTVRLMPVNKRARPNSLPLIPLVDFNTSYSPDFSSTASCLTPFSFLSSTSDTHGCRSLEQDLNISARNSVQTKINQHFPETNDLEFKTKLSCELTKSLNDFKSANRTLSTVLNPEYSASFEGIQKRSEYPKDTDLSDPKESLTDYDERPISLFPNNMNTHIPTQYIQLSPLGGFTATPKHRKSPTFEPRNEDNTMWKGAVFASPPAIVSKSEINECQREDEDVAVNEENSWSEGDIPMNFSQNQSLQREFPPTRDVSGNLETKMKSILDDLESMIVAEAQYDRELRDDYDMRGSITFLDPGIRKSKLNTLQEENDCYDLSNEIKIKNESRNYIDDDREIQRSFSTTPIFEENTENYDLHQPKAFTNISILSIHNDGANDYPQFSSQPTYHDLKSDSRYNQTTSVISHKNEDVDVLNERKDRNYIWIGTAEKVVSEKDDPSPWLKTDTLPSFDHRIEPNPENKGIFSTTTNTDLNLSSSSSPNSLDMSVTPSVHSCTQPDSSSPILPNPMLGSFANHSENISYPWSAEGGAIYKAEVQVMQKPSLPTAPTFDLPISEIPRDNLHLLEAAKEEEKRNSFNLAAKGWGTYNNFYTPLHLGTV